MLEPIANAWRDEGATGFSFWNSDSEVASWSWGVSRLPVLTSSVKTDRRQFGELRVEGVARERVPNRLLSDATLVATVLNAESQLREMTVDLADCQDQLVAVFDLARASQGQIDIDDVLSTLVSEASDLTQAYGAFVLFSDQTQNHVKVLPIDTFTSDHDSLVRIFDVVKNTQRTRLLDKEGLNSLGVFLNTPTATLIAVPVRIDGQIKAVLGVARDGNRPFSAGSRTLLEAIGAQAGSLLASALALRSAIIRERIQRDVDLAAAVQRTLIVRDLPAVPGLGLAGRYLPAAEIGGDLYDLFKRTDGKLVVTVADVSGKGIPAALVMGMTRTALHGAAKRHVDPASALNSINVELYDDLSDLSKFVTACMVFYDPVLRTLEIANCGHSPVILCPANGSARLLEPDAPPIGVLAGNVSTLRSENLALGDVLVIGTDGISEADAVNGQMYGYDRLLECVETLRAEEAPALADAILLDVRQFSLGVSQSDDQALVVLKGMG